MGTGIVLIEQVFTDKLFILSNYLLNGNEECFMQLERRQG
jgi:hypothetical protein